MTETIEIEVTDGVREQYDNLVEAHGELDVQAGLLQTVTPFIRENHAALKEDDE